MKKLVSISACLLAMALACPCLGEEVRQGTLTGIWAPLTGPIAEARVSLFNEASGPPPSQKRSRRAADRTTSTDAKGRFSLQVPAGAYYLGMTKHRLGSHPGPPQEGELHHFGRDDKGKPKLYRVLPGKTTDVGVIGDAAPYEKMNRTATTAIEGTVADETGNPAAGVLVFAYTTPEMEGKPMYVSERTGADGKYLLVVDEGEYYLKIRSRHGGGQPEAGEIMGGYGEFGAPGAVVVRQGAVTRSIDIQGLRFPGRGQRQTIESAAPPAPEVPTNDANRP